jgi:hypothetical protein
MSIPVGLINLLLTGTLLSAVTIMVMPRVNYAVRGKVHGWCLTNGNMQPPPLNFDRTCVITGSEEKMLLHDAAVCLAY